MFDKGQKQSSMLSCDSSYYVCRYTPLDYALMGEHLEVAQYMLEQGALSMIGIQDIAARENIVDQNDTKLI